MCDNLKNIVLPEGITSINEFAFGSCTTLQTIELPSTLKEIKANAFNKCESLHALTLSGIEPPVFTPDEFEMQHLNVYVPLMAIETYRQTDGWKNLKNLFGK